MHPISWAIASLPGSEYHPYLKGIRQGATREVAGRDKTLKRWYTVMEAVAGLARLLENGENANDGSRRCWWRHVFRCRSRAGGSA
jgi:hypothetical protein